MRGDVLGELQPAAAFGIWFRVTAGEYGREAPWHFLAEIPRIATDVKADIGEVLFVLVLHSHDERDVGQVLAELVDFLAHRREVVGGSAAQLALEAPAAERQQCRLAVVGAGRVVEVCREDVAPQLETLGFHRLELELMQIEEALEAVRHRRRLDLFERRALGDDLLVLLLELVALGDDL